MKKLSVLLVMLLLLCGALLADITQYYTFSASTGTYTQITGTPQTTDDDDDGITAAIQIGFPFVYGTNTYNQVCVSTNGYIFLGSTTSSTYVNNLTSTTDCPVIAPLWDDLLLPTTGSIQTQLTGTAPNRIFTVQFTGMHWNYTATTNAFNFQAKLYETGKVEFVYGSFTGTPTSPSASIGMNMLPGGNNNFLSVTPGTEPTASSTVQNSTITAMPASGTTYAFNVAAGMAILTGTVTAGGNPLQGASVSIVGSTLPAQITDAAGHYTINFVTPGNIQVTASKVGYATLTQPAVMVADQTTTLNFALVALPVVNVTGTVVGSDAPTVGLADATVTLTGAQTFTGTTNAQGQFTIPGVFTSSTYAYTVTKTGYQNATGNINVGTTNFSMGTITMNEIALPATSVVAAENTAHTAVNVIWEAPGTGGGEWIEWDNGENNDSIGTNGNATFDVASRWPASELIDFVGMSLYAVKYFPAQAATYRVRVWTGGGATGPATMVVDAAVTPTLAEWNTFTLPTPVPIVANQELWFGYNVVATTGYPAGCDAGPQHEGLGNMIYWQNAWTTLSALSATLTYDWNLAGFVGFAPPARFAGLQALPYNPHYNNAGTLATSGVISKLQNNTVQVQVNDIRVLTGYKVWRLLVGQEANEASWTLLTTNPITATAYSDAAWNTLPDGQYKWAVKAIYTNNVMANAAFSNAVTRLTQVGTIAGVVHGPNDTALAGVTITAGTVTATSNASGAYSMSVPAGVHTVVATKTGYTTQTQTGVVVITGQTTTVNFTMPVSTQIEDGFEAYANFAIDFAPWVVNDVDGSTTYGYTGYTWENGYAAQAWMVFNPSATTPSAVAVMGDAHTGSKMAACWADTTPPNNDWLITPAFRGGGSISFWARSMSADYPDEQFKVGVSTTGTAPGNFTIISGAAPITTTTEWAQYTYQLTTTNPTQNIRVGIECVSNDQFALFLDDVIMVQGTNAGEDPNVPVVATALLGNHPNPFNPETTISYSVKGSSPVVVEVYNTKGQKVKTLVNEAKTQGTYNVKWNGTDENGKKVTSGVYFFKMKAGTYSSSKKMILMK